MSNIPSPSDDAASARPTAPVPNLNIEFYRKRAKALLKQLRAGSPEAKSRFGATQSPLRDITTAKLADAQCVVARESGFASWTRLKHYIEGAPPRFRPYERDIKWYLDRAEGLRRAYIGRMQNVHEVIRQYHPRFAGLSDAEMEQAKFSGDDAKLIQARQHGFDSWKDLAHYIACVKQGEVRDTFLQAFEALKANESEILRELLRVEPELAHAQGSNGNSLLNLAASLTRNEACQVLLDAGVPVNRGNNYGWTALHQAAASGNFSLVEKLVAAGGSLTLSARGDGGTPLVQALFWGNAEMADFLAAYNITPKNLRVAAGLGRLELLEACFDAAGRLTSEAKANREFYRPHGEFPEWSPSGDSQEVLDEAFAYACRNGRTDVLAFLLERGSQIGSDTYRGMGLIWASHKGHEDTVRWLVAHGANINQQATFGGRQHGWGVTALHLACQNGPLERVRLLIELGADPDIPDHYFNVTPTDWADFFKHREIVDYLLGLPNAGILNLASRGLTERVAQELERDESLANGGRGETRAYPLHRSVANGHLDTARLLLEHGANPNLQLSNGQNAFDIAVEKGDEAMIQLLRQFGATQP